MRIQTILYRFPYLIGIGLYTLFIWAFQLGYIGVPISILAMLVILFFVRDSSPTLPILFSLLFMISHANWELGNIPIYIFAIPVFLTIGYVIHIIKYKTSLAHGKLLIALLALEVASFLSMINSFQRMDLMYSIYGLFLLLTYLFYRNTIHANRIHYFIQNMIVFGMVVSLEVFIHYLRVPDYWDSIASQSINLGWGNTTEVSAFLLLFIPATFYYAKLTKFNFTWIFLGFFEIIMLLLCFSRGGILTFLFVFIFLLIYVFRSKYWRSSLSHYIIILLIATVLIYSNWGLFEAIFHRFRELLLNDINRIPIYETSIAKFLNHPLFGNGVIFYQEPLSGMELSYNLFLQTLVWFGIVGGMALLYQLGCVFQVVIYQTRPKTRILGISLMGAFILGMIDNVYYMPQFMMIYLIMMAFIETSNRHFDYYLIEDFDARM